MSIKELQHRYNSETLFLIGNGPSLNDCDMTLLKDKYTFSFNRAYIAYQDWGLIPSFYSCVDEVVLPDNKSEINDMIRRDQYRDTFFFFPKWGEKSIQGSEQTFFLEQYYRGQTFEENIEKFVVLGNVGASAMQIAIYLGFANVVLLGCDCNYVEKPNDARVDESETERVGGIAYESEADTDPNHFCPGYFGKGKKYRIPNAEGHLRGWREVKKWIDVFNDQNEKAIHVWNVSKQSRLDFFDYLPFGVAVEECFSSNERVTQEREPVVVFGAGSDARRLLYENRNVYDVRYFVDNYNGSTGNTLFGKSIYSPSKLVDDAACSRVLVAIPDGEKKVGKQLRELGVYQKALFLDDVQEVRG